MTVPALGEEERGILGGHRRSVQAQESQFVHYGRGCSTFRKGFVDGPNKPSTRPGCGGNSRSSLGKICVNTRMTPM